MEKEIDILNGLISEYWGEIHHVEEQRSTLTNMLLVIESASIVLIMEADYEIRALPLCLLLILFGILGTLATRKYYERSRYAQSRLTQWYKKVDDLCPGAEVMNSLRAANEIHEESKTLMLFKRYHMRRLPLNRIWNWIHATFIIAGVILSLIVVIGEVL